MKRVFIIVLDSCGIGEMPDAKLFGDKDCNTLKRISCSPCFSCENMAKMGLGNIDGIDYIKNTSSPSAAFGRLSEASNGKDTTVGHWEIAGVVSEHPLPTYPNGFPEELICRLEKETGCSFICNKPYSGTEVIKDYGDEHVKTGSLIIYTSVDSVCQIAAHESVVPVEKLYEYCSIARRVFSGADAVGRIIARPFTDGENGFVRTANRRDFSVEPPQKTLLDEICENGMSVISIGKISDIFAGHGITEAHISHSNSEGKALTADVAKKDFEGLCFTNLVDFDMLYGHRQDIDGYASAFSEFDKRLPEITKLLRDNDILIITADHGCDPGDSHTDHTREYVPLLVYGKNIKPTDLGTRNSFSDIAATVAEYLGIRHNGHGNSFLELITEK